MKVVKKKSKYVFSIFENMKSVALLLLLINFISPTHAQTYPIQLTTQLVPPFSGYVPDYSTAGNQNLKLLVLFTDFSKPTYNIKLKIKLSGQGITLQSKNYYYSAPFALQPGAPLEISGSDLAELLSINNLDFSGISANDYKKRGVLPEGFYTICFTAYDYNNPTQIQVSNQSCAAAWMVLSDPPMLNMPFCGKTLKTFAPQNILFQWTAMNLTSPNSAGSTQYDFELYEVKPGTQNPGNIIQTLPPIYKATTPNTFANYGITEPELNVNMEYVWRVKAQDASGRDLFKNGGYSQICTFKYGDLKSQTDTNALKPHLEGKAISYRLLKYNWTTVDVFGTYKLAYRKQGGVNWFSVTTNDSSTTIPNMEPEAVYEAKVQGVSKQGSGPWSNIVTLTTAKKPDFACGQGGNMPSMDNFKPHQTGKAGQIWDVGQFEILVTSLEVSNNPSGLYSGYGKIDIPFLAGMNLKGKFSNILVNDEYRVIKGQVDILSSGINGSNILNLDSLFNEIDKLFDDFYTNKKDTTEFIDELMKYKDAVCKNSHREVSRPTGTSRVAEENTGARMAAPEPAQGEGMPPVCNMSEDDLKSTTKDGTISKDIFVKPGDKKPVKGKPVVILSDTTMTNGKVFIYTGKDNKMKIKFEITDTSTIKEVEYKITINIESPKKELSYPASGYEKLKFNVAKEITLDSIPQGKYTITCKLKNDISSMYFYIRKKKLEITTEQLKNIFPNLKDDTRAKQVVDAINKYSTMFGISTPERMAHFIGQIGAETGAELKELQEDASYTARGIVNTFGLHKYGHLFEEAVLTKTTYSYSYSSVNYEEDKCITDAMSQGTTVFNYDTKAAIVSAYADEKKDTVVTLNNKSTTVQVYKYRTDVTANNLTDKVTQKSYNSGRLRVKGGYINSKTLFDVTYACRLGNGNVLSKEGSRYKGIGYIHLTGKDKFVGNSSISAQKEWKDTYPNIDLSTQAGMDKLTTDVEVAIFASMVYWKKNDINKKADEGIDTTDGTENKDNPLISNVGKLVNGTNPPNGNSSRIKNTKKAYEQLK